MHTNELLPREIAEIEEESDPLLVATLEFEEAARYLDLEDWIVHQLRHPEREVTLNLPLRHDHGEVTTVGAIRVQHHSGGQPTLGPVRLSREAHPHQVRASAMEATWQLALLEVPFGGAAGAVLCDPAELSEHELQQVARAYVWGLRGLVDPSSDILSPGAGCNEQTMAWMLSGHARHDPRPLAVVAGKPAVLWGLPGYYAATAHGVSSILQHILGTSASKDVTGQRVTIQGFGATGRGIAHLLLEAGARLVGIADISGGMYNPKGLDLNALEAHVGRQGVLFGYAGADPVCNADMLESECDVLVLAAAERQITLTNAGRIKAPLIMETSRGAITRAAEQALVARGVSVIPALLANAGAAIAAYTEWQQNTRSALQPGTELQETIAIHIARLYGKASATAEQKKLSLWRAALLLAIDRVAAQMRLAGRN